MNLISRVISHASYKVIKHTVFENVVLLIILFNTVTLILDDPTSTSTSEATENIELFFLVAYSIEMVLKIIGLGFILPKGAYLRDGWNILDFTIVVSSYIPILFEGSSGVNLQSLRSLRVLRPLRTITTIRPLKVLLGTIFASIPYLVNTIIILFFFFLVFAIGGVQLYKGLLKFRCFHHANGINLTSQLICGGSQSCPDHYLCGKGLANPNFGVTNFDTIFYSFLMVFQCVTLEGWTEIMYWIFDSFSVYTFLYFVVLVVVGAFFLLNLTLAVIKAKFTAQEQETEPDKPKDQKQINDDDVDDFLENQEQEIENPKKTQKTDANEDSSDEEI